MNRLNELLQLLKIIEIRDIAEAPPDDQPALVEYIEGLQDQLIAIGKQSESKRNSLQISQ